MSCNRIDRARDRAWQKAVLLTLSGLALMLVLLAAQPAQATEPALGPEAPGTISGLVTNDEGAPLAGIDVLVYQGQPSGWQIVRTLRTDAAGAYRAAVLATGNYRIGFRDPQGRYALEFNDNAITLESAADISIAGNDIQGVNARLSVGSTISGSVAFTGTFQSSLFWSTGIVQAFSKINGKWLTVAAAEFRPPSSAYSLTLLPVGNYRVCAFIFYLRLDQGKYEECFDNIASGIDNAQDVPAAAGQTTSNINLVLGDQADLATLGGVVSAADGKLLPAIAVTIYRADLTVVAQIETDQAGAYQVGRLRPGEYVVGFSDPAGTYLAKYYKNSLLPVTATPLVLQPNEKKLDVNISLEAGAQIVGSVLLVSQTVASNANVQILDVGNALATVRSVAVDPRTGLYRSGALFPGSYKVLATVNLGGDYALNGYYGGQTLAQAKDVVLGPGETKAEINIVVGAGAFDGGISGVILAADGSFRPGIRVGLLRADPNTSPTESGLVYRTTDANGRYAIGGLIDGPYWLLVSDPVGIYATTYHGGRGVVEIPAPITVLGGQVVADTNVQLVRGGAISGRIYQRNGAGVVDAQVTLFAGEGKQALPISTLSSDNGSYKISGIRPGLYRLCASHVQFIGRCYGGNLESALVVSVVAESEVKNVDILIGVEAPKLLYLPLVDR